MGRSQILTHPYHIGIFVTFIGYDVDCEERVDAVYELQLCEECLHTPASAVFLPDVPVVCITLSTTLTRFDMFLTRA